MFKRYSLIALIVVVGTGAPFYAATGIGQQRAPASPDAVEEAQSPRPPSSKRVEQKKKLSGPVRHFQRNCCAAVVARA